MSGPKLSEAEIEELKRQELERQRQEKIRRMKVVMGRYREVVDNITNLCTSCDTLKKDYLISSAVLSGDERSFFRKQIEGIIETIETVLKECHPATEEEYVSCTKRMQETFEKAEEYAGHVTGRLNIAMQKMSNLNSVSCYHVNSVINQIEQEDISEWKNINISFQKTDDNKYISKEEQRSINLKQDELFELEEKERLYDEYVALAVTLKKEIKPYGDFPSAKDLESEIDDYWDEYQQKDEMDYIADQVNQVMVDLGYSFVKSTVLNKSRDSHMILFPMGSEQDCSLYKADEKTGIVVFTGDNGDVMMQTTVIGEGEITESDREWSYQRQIDFCSAHPEIVEALEQKGVLLYQKSYCAPSRDYTRKISGLTDTTETQIINRRERRRRTARNTNARHKE